MPTGCLSRQAGWRLHLGVRKTWTGCQARPCLRVALLVSRGEQQLPVNNISSSRFPVDGCTVNSACWLSQAGEEATHHQYKLQTPGRLRPWAGGGLRGLISRAEGLPQQSDLRVLFLIFF